MKCVTVQCTINMHKIPIYSTNYAHYTGTTIYTSKQPFPAGCALQALPSTATLTHQCRSGLETTKAHSPAPLRYLLRRTQIPFLPSGHCTATGTRSPPLVLRDLRSAATMERARCLARCLLLKCYLEPPDAAAHSRSPAFRTAGLKDTPSCICIPSPNSLLIQLLDILTESKTRLP